ncbi:MAG: enoyl-CoA hydratase-related protein [Tetrasphaera sp.]
MTQPGARVVVTTEGPVATITMTAPERLNAVDPAMLEELTAAVGSLDADPAVRVIAITGAGRGFCAGADLGAGRDITPDNQQDVDLSATLYGAGRLVRAIVTARTPTVALVGGVAAGAGLSIALACDYSLATESASFTMAFVKIGLMPDCGSTALVAANIGRAKALRMALTGERIPAPVAEAWGLICECVADEAYAERSRALLAQLAGSAPVAVAATSAAVTAAVLDLEAALAVEESGQVALLQTADFREGVAAFLEKRAARFQGH